MRVQKSFFSEVSHAIDLKAEKTTRKKKFNCKEAEGTEVIKKVNSEKGGHRNHRWRRQTKKTTMSPIIAK